MERLKTTNTLLVIIVISLVFFILKTLSFIFIPLMASMFIALLFLPLMRWLTKRKVHKIFRIAIAIIIILMIFKIGVELVKLTSQEIVSTKDVFLEEAETKIVDLIISAEAYFGIERLKGDSVLKHYFQNTGFLSNNLGITVHYLRSMITGLLMTLFFAVLLLSESINIEKIMNTTLIKRKHASVKVFRKIEKDIIKFIKVKFVISLFTGLGFTLACLAFDVSFPIFWGVLAFFINFVQMIGSVISVVALSLFAFAELDPSGTLLFFILTITGVQVLMGAILEPIFLGKTFSINVVTILIMLMLWGYIWGVPGLIMSIPITVCAKIIFEEFPATKPIATLMSGS